MTDLAGVVRRNTLVLAGCLTLSLAVWQLIGATVPIVSERALGTELAGIGLAIITISGALAAVPAGRFMDRRGRVAGISIGFALATLGALLLYVAARSDSALVLIAGFVVIGAGLGVVALARVGAADMYPPERRASGIGRVLVGAAVGALAGIAIFTTALQGQTADANGLATPWLIAALLLGVGALFVRLIRVDPIAVATELRVRAGGVVEPRRGLRIIFAQPALRAAFAAAFVAQLVMASSMPLMGLVMHHHGRSLSDISLAFGSHLFGMYALAPVVGTLVDRLGRVRALVAGLGVLAGAVFGLTQTELALLMPAMFLVGVGWNIAYVSATALVADGTAPSERAGALGTVDLMTVGTGALAAAIAPPVLVAIGIANLVLIAATVAFLPAILIARLRIVARPSAA